MRIARYEFSPPLWALPVFAAVLALLLALGVWQVRRGGDKAAIIAERVAASKKPPVALLANGHIATGDAAAGRRVEVSGEYLPDRQLLLDNQVWKGEAGYEVWTPLRTSGGQLVMVDRGWVALGKDRRHPPNPAAPAGMQKVVGFWRHWPQPGIRLGQEVCPEGQWPRTVVYPEYPQVACNYDETLLDGLLLLDPHAKGGFPRDWEYLGLPPMRHYGYAVQWFALAIALCAIFIGVNTRKIRSSETRETE